MCGVHGYSLFWLSVSSIVWSIRLFVFLLSVRCNIAEEQEVSDITYIQQGDDVDDQAEQQVPDVDSA
jgi:hypothetical protein